MKKTLLVLIIAILATSLSLIYFLTNRSDNEVKKLVGLDDFATIAIDNDSILYHYFDDTTPSLIMGKYDINTHEKTNLGSVDNFYMTYDAPALANDTIYLPITLSSVEHDLLIIDLKNNTMKKIFTSYNSDLLESISTMSGEIYLLSGNLDEDGIYSTYIGRYNAATEKIDVCILKKSLSQDNGEIIKSFACNGGKIYSITEKKDGTLSDTYIDVYDSADYSHLETLFFYDELKAHIDTNNLAQFYAFDDYIYIRNYLDEGMIGKIKSNSISSVLTLPGLRIAYNNKNTKDEYYAFFIRHSNQFYILDIKNDSLLKGAWPLQQNESILGTISTGDKICRSVFDESANITKETGIFSYKYLLGLCRFDK